MSRVFQSTELEGIATYWRILRRDGIALGFTSHDRDLILGGMRYRAAPGMVPSAIRRDAGLESELLEVEGVLSHDAICAADLANGRFDHARVTIGICDWETLEHAALFSGKLSTVSTTGLSFQAELRSAKDSFLANLVPRTSPTCRAAFCDAQCQLGAAGFTHLVAVSAIDHAASSVTFDTPQPAENFRHGSIRWIDGPAAGLLVEVADISGAQLILDSDLSVEIASGHRAFLREGCDHTLATCAGRFDNAINFRGEPYLPGNDILARYATSAT